MFLYNVNSFNLREFDSIGGHSCATEENKKTFPQHFQEMVHTLLEHGDDVIEVIRS